MYIGSLEVELSKGVREKGGITVNIKLMPQFKLKIGLGFKLGQ